MARSEIKYSFLQDRGNRWSEFWYTVTPDQPERIAEQIRTIEEAESELFKAFKVPSETAAVKRFFSGDLLTHSDEIRNYKKRQKTDFFFSVS